MEAAKALADERNRLIEALERAVRNEFGWRTYAIETLKTVGDTRDD